MVLLFFTIATRLLYFIKESIMISQTLQPELFGMVQLGRHFINIDTEEICSQYALTVIGELVSFPKRKDPFLIISLLEHEMNFMNLKY